MAKENMSKNIELDLLGNLRFEQALYFIQASTYVFTLKI